MYADMEFWTEVRRRVLTGQLSKRAACREYELGWHTLAKILAHQEPPGYRKQQPRKKPKLEEFLPIIHLVFSNLKTWLNGIHHGVSAKHLQAYLNEFTFRFNRRFYPVNAFRSLLGIAGGAEAPTFAELYSGEWSHPTCSGCLR